MKKRIRNGQYEFPPNEWSHVSTAAKTLIRSLLQTNPGERLSIEQVFNDQWIANHTTVPQTPLCTQAVLREEQSNWPEVQDEMNNALNQMRVDQEDAMKLKPLPQAKNQLAKKREQRVASAALGGPGSVPSSATPRNGVNTPL